MPAPRWATARQLAFLKDRLPAHSKAQGDSSLTTFWTETYRDFFAQWPDRASEIECAKDSPISDHDGEPATTEAKKKRKKKKKSTSNPDDQGDDENGLSQEQWVTVRRESIYNWYNNHGLNKGTRRAGQVKSVRIVLQQPTTRVSTEYHLYSKRYYDSRVKADVDNEIGDKNVERSQRIAIINKHLVEKYNNESEEIKQEIRTAIEEQRAEKEAQKKAYESIANCSGTPTAEEYMIAQAVAPEMVKDFFEMEAARTGWAFSVFGGGPAPEKNGAIRTFAIHCGVNQHGLSFAKFIPQHQKRYVVPYSSFLKTMYPNAPNDPRFQLAHPVTPDAKFTDSVFHSTIEVGTDLDEAIGNIPDQSAATSTSVALHPKVSMAPSTTSGMTQPTGTTFHQPSEVAPSQTVSATPPQQKMPETEPQQTVLAASVLPATISPPFQPPQQKMPLAAPIPPAMTTPPFQPPQQNTVPGAPVPSATPTPPFQPPQQNTALGAPVPPATPMPQLPQQNTVPGAPVPSATPTPTFQPTQENTALGAPVPPATPMLPFQPATTMPPLQPPHQNTVLTGAVTPATRMLPYHRATTETAAARSDTNMHPAGQYSTTDMWNFSGIDDLGGGMNDLSMKPDYYGSTLTNKDYGYAMDREKDFETIDAVFDPEVMKNMMEPNEWEEIMRIVNEPSTGVHGETHNDYHVDSALASTQNSDPSTSASQPQHLQPTTTNLPQPIMNTVTSASQPSINTDPSSQMTPPENDHDMGQDENGANEPRSGAGRTRKAPSKEVVPLTSNISAAPTQPEWLETAHAYLVDGIDDGSWKKCITDWIAFERDGLTEISAHRLPAAFRPPVLTKWMASRKYSKIPVIEDRKALSTEWLKWWNSIQPEWRQVKEPNSLPLPLDTSKDVLNIKKSGPSGLVTVLIGLKWWYGLPDTTETWIAAVKDVNHCFEVSSAVLSQKRGAESQGSGKGRRKKRRTE